MRRFACLLFAAFFITPLSGHDTWIAPDRFDVTPPARVTLSLTSGMEFPKLDHAIQRDRVAVAKLRTSQGRNRDLLVGRGAPHALEMTARLTTRGVTTFWLVLHPRPSELKPQQVREYIEHLGLAEPDRVIAAWERKGEPKQLRYRYTKYAKTFVRARKGDAGRQWSKPAAMRLELVPEDDPTIRRPGSSIRFVLLRDSRPLAKYPVFLISEGTSHPAEFKTDDEGRVRIELPRSGRQMVRATTLEPSTASGVEWDVHFTTATFNVD